MLEKTGGAWMGQWRTGWWGEQVRSGQWEGQRGGGAVRADERKGGAKTWRE